MFIELYKFSKLVMHLNSCYMDLSHDTNTMGGFFYGLYTGSSSNPARYGFYFCYG